MIKFIMKYILLLFAVTSILRGLTQAKEVLAKPSIANDDLALPPLMNPYSDPNFCGRKVAIAHPQSDKDCHALQEQSIQPIESNTVIKSVYCIRKMTKPSQKCFKKAIQDGVAALSQDNTDRFQEIMRSWPVASRKEFHDKVTAEVNRRGLDIQSTMPAFDSTQAPKNRYEKIIRGPFHREVLPNDIINVEDDIQFIL